MNDNFHDFFSDSIIKFESMINSNKFLFFDSEEFESIIIYYLESGNSSMANKAIKMAIEQYPKNTSILLLKVEALIFENNIEEAEKIIDSLYEIDRNNSEIIIQKSRILSKRKKHSKSINLLKKISKDCEFYSDALVMIGKEYLFIDNFENAKEKFKEYIKNHQLDYAVLNNLLYCFDALGNTDNTINYLNDFLEENPYCEVAWHQLGKQYLKKELFKEALTAFDFAIISDDSFVGAYLEMGKVLEKLNKINQAIEQYEIVTKIDEPNPFALYRIACCHNKLGNIELAISYYNKTVEEDPIHDSAWMSLATSYYKQKDYLEAKNHLIKAIEIDSENIKYWELYCKINLDLNNNEEVEISFKEILSLGNLSLSTLIFLTKTLIQIPLNESLSNQFLIKIDALPNSLLSEKKYISYVILNNSNQIIKANFNLKEAYFHNPAIYDYFKDIFPTIPQLNVFKNMNVN
ncbi:tetratricopeptide repeat protein [Flavobacteriaceae bacterium]|nr:tetratricopeptide repeat protein [Flavobacteriaceae bacterium]MDB0023227.1 tetratricopeptide repeat protein [Flavobacteriaceae bacterium]MDB2567425.1 tetratricopeptide repeat protein [Flavobacteriaceae bacterium]MDB4601489.1 tetratricopeptide repeat protein [Flavobacteriaceae bacterium]MDC0506305.1 tetratricopeptide repeat protein [Flavobacteriaceae bacterium]